MTTTTNTRQLTGASDAECKCMALMQHLGNPYFVDGDGYLYGGREEDANEKYSEAMNGNKIEHIPFESWLQEHGLFEPIDTTLDAINDVGYLVLNCENSYEIQDHKELICGQTLAGMEVINDNLYLIFQL